MSIVLGRNNSSDHRIEPSGFAAHGMTSIPIYNSPEFGIGDPRDQEDDRSSSFSSSSSSSSIGRNSDDSPAGRSSSDGDGEEVQSSFKPGGLDNLETLEEILPIKYVDFLQLLILSSFSLYLLGENISNFKKKLF
uniref:Putative ovule protein n=1 Tax=Solanum chacoense TaxID=4108 RepID=A0A0V0HB31_SOLCH